MIVASRPVAAAVWVGSALALAAAAHQVHNLRVLRRPRPDPPPVAEPVSVCVPARDEVARIGRLVAALLGQTGVPDLEVLVLDDGSTDGTAAVARAAGGRDPRLRVLAGSPPPPGTLGKPHACAQLAAMARGSVLVFVDADVTVAPPAVAAAVEMLRSAGLDLLSPWPRQLADGLLPRLMQPLLTWSWSVSLPLRLLERSPRAALVAANGQFLVLDAAALARAGGFAAVTGEVLDDIALARAVKCGGGRIGIADGSDLAACRMYADGPEVVAGWTKSLWTAFGPPASCTAVAGLFALVYVLPPLAALRGSRVGLVGYAAAVATRVLDARRAGTRAWPDAAAHPLSVTALLALLVRSWVGHRRGTLTWKGRPLPTSPPAPSTTTLS